MENKMKKEEMLNLKSPNGNKASQQDKKGNTPDAGYTAQEDQFADGKGTQLAEEFNSKKEADETNHLNDQSEEEHK